MRSSFDHQKHSTPGRLLAAAGLCALTISACGQATPTSAPGTSAVTPTPTTASAPAAVGSSKTAPSAAAAQVAGSYITLADYKSNPQKYDSQRVVFFFHAPWCPSCRGTEQDVVAHAGSFPEKLTLVKVDYDSETDLKQKYGITTQHSFVWINPPGGAAKKWSGSPTVADIAAQATAS
jgi:thioredoxin 1